MRVRGFVRSQDGSSAEFYGRRQAWLMLLVLFLAFRLLALLLFRPGGYLTNVSDYDYYGYVIGHLSVQGYFPNANLVTAYPPLFPALVVPIFWLASLFPPWVDPRLAFHTLLGLMLLIFETGNFLLIGDLARRLAGEGSPAGPDQAPEIETLRRGPAGIDAVLWPPLLYALLFAPVYTWLGWFECMPLFWLLLGLDLLLMARRSMAALALSAMAAAFGTLTKLTPIILVPIALPWLGTRLTWRAVRHEWFQWQQPGSLRKPAVYAAVCLATVLVAGYALVHANPGLALASVEQLNKREPWETIWALLVGYYSFGVFPVDERDPGALARLAPTSGLPWPLITAIFGLLYLVLYVIPYDWRRRRTVVAFTFATLLWLFLYNRGWSPQFQLWVLAFIVLLWPNLFGVILAVAFSFINYAEAHIYFDLLPGQYWLLAATVTLRTLLMIAFLALALADIWPQLRPARWLSRAGRTLAGSAVLAGVVGAVLVLPVLGQAYFAARLADDPCRDAILYLQGRAGQPPRAIAMERMDAWQEFYPWLRNDYQLLVVDSFDPGGDPQVKVETELEELARNQGGAFWWLEKPKQPDGELEESYNSVADRYFARPDVSLGTRAAFGACYLTRVEQTPTSAQGHGSARPD